MSLANYLAGRRVSDTEKEKYERQLVRANASDNVEARFAARQKAALTQPKRSLLLDQGSANAMLDLIRYYTCPVQYLGGYYTGVRLLFARMSDEERVWCAIGGVTLYKSGDEHFIVQPADSAISRLMLSFDGSIVRRERDPSEQRCFTEPRGASWQGVRLG